MFHVYKNQLIIRRTVLPWSKR